MLLTGIETDVFGEKCPTVTLMTTNSTRTSLGTKPGFPKKTPRVWLIAWTMIGPYYVILDTAIIYLTSWPKFLIGYHRENCSCINVSHYRSFLAYDFTEMRLNGSCIFVYILYNTCFISRQSLVGLSLLIFDIYRTHTDTPQTVRLLWTSDRPKQRTLTTHDTHKRQTSMCQAGFEPAISARQRQQIHALDRAATGIGRHHFRISNSVAVM